MKGCMIPMVNLAPNRILIVDDDPDLIGHLSDTLRLVGKYEVVIANDGVEGLEMFVNTRPDCVIVDVRMPHINGNQFVRALRGDPTSTQTPIIILSALVQDVDEQAGMLSGADIYLRKPVKIAELLEAVQRAMALSETNRTQRLIDLADDDATNP